MRIFVKVNGQDLFDDTEATEFTTALEAKEHIEANFSDGLKIAAKVVSHDEDEADVEFSVFDSKEEARKHIDECCNPPIPPSNDGSGSDTPPAE